jgi:predicted N-acetyltransferase YhbS
MTQLHEVDADLLPTRITVRTAGPDDHEHIRAVLRAAYGQYALSLPAEVYDSYLADLLDVERHAQVATLLVAEIDGLIVGSAAFQPDIGVQRLGWPEAWAGGRALAVLPEARGLGVARALISTCEQLARKHGAPVFAFHTTGVMTAAVRLYERLGYERVPEYDVEVGTGLGISLAQPIPVIAYRRVLGHAPLSPGRDHVSCPECGGPSLVEWRCHPASTSGSVPHAKISCEDRHWFLMPEDGLTPYRRG